MEKNSLGEVCIIYMYNQFITYVNKKMPVFQINMKIHNASQLSAEIHKSFHQIFVTIS